MDISPLSYVWVIIFIMLLCDYCVRYTQQTWCELYNGIWTPVWLLWDWLFYRAFPLALSVLPPCLSASLAHWVKAGVYRNSRQAGPCHTAERHRNVLYALERQDSWGKIVHQVPQTRPVRVKTGCIYKPVKGQSKWSITRCFARRYAVRYVSFCAVKQESHTRTHKWAAEESLRLPVSAAALKAHTVNWGSGVVENPDRSLIFIWGKNTF